MEAVISKRKALVKNTLFLYGRMLLSMLVSLYTSRVILQYLGVEDFGIYNAVGGVVAMFGMISGALSTSIGRTLTFNLGVGNIERLKKVFSMSINVQILIVAIIIILGETIAIWFLNSKMVIPKPRINAANWILQFSLITFSLNLISVPYNASLIAHEKMDIFAYIGIVDAVLRLIIVYFIAISPIDKLVFYGFLLMVESLAIQVIYLFYCKRCFIECKYTFCRDKDVFRELAGFATWSFIGSTSSVLRSQGVNILLNLFFGPVVNAARAISMQVNNAVNSFVTNFMTALTPQITKAYAQQEYKYLLQCIYKGSKFSFFLLYFLSLPVIVETDYILELWLINVPDRTVWFVRYILLYSLIDTYSRTLINANNATGDIKTYQIVIGTLNLMVVPIVYMLLKFGCPAETSVLVSIAISIIGIVPRIYFNKKHFPITYTEFAKEVILPTILVSSVGLILPIIISNILSKTLMSFVLTTISCMISSSLTIMFLGCTTSERNMALSYITNKKRRDNEY